MEYLIKINDFEGPLDLLLHLIRESNIDIQEINIVDITNQYLDYINKMEELNIDVASSYLVMAATLMELKSKSLLPTEDKEDIEEYSEDETRETLIQKLIEYQKYKEITKDFKLLETERKNIYTKSPEKINELLNEKFINDTDITIDDLKHAMEEFLKRKNMERPIHTKITNKEYSVKKRKNDIRKFLRDKKKVEFTDLFKNFNKSYIIVTFLAILELVKENNIIIKQENNFETITIEEGA